ncbi:hypothetical protein MesoLjLb_36750 [Mesorhizobium sp. L-8-3]|nr:hypothetical protein MesoLjLb_36750 [Mesorhizobium sp. L-8-3]
MAAGEREHLPATEDAVKASQGSGGGTNACLPKVGTGFGTKTCVKSKTCSVLREFFFTQHAVAPRHRGDESEPK